MEAKRMPVGPLELANSLGVPAAWMVQEDWDEDKHPRDGHGRFGSGGGGGPSGGSPPAAAAGRAVPQTPMQKSFARGSNINIAQFQEKMYQRASDKVVKSLDAIQAAHERGDTAALAKLNQEHAVALKERSAAGEQMMAAHNDLMRDLREGNIYK